MSEFKIRSEADCERISKVIIQWYKNKVMDLINDEHIVDAPNEQWAVFFTSIFADDVERNHLEDICSKYPVKLFFEVQKIADDDFKKEIELMSDEDLMDAIDEYLREMLPEEEEDDLDEEDEDNNA